MDSFLKAKLAKYTTKLKARKLVFDQKYSYTTARLVRAHEKLAKIHTVACNIADQGDIDKVYARAMSSNHGTTPPEDGDYDDILEQLTFSPLDDEDLERSLTRVRRNFRTTMQSWERLETEKFRLTQVEEMTHELYSIIRLKKGFFWAFFNVHCSTSCWVS